MTTADMEDIAYSRDDLPLSSECFLRLFTAYSRHITPFHENKGHEKYMPKIVEWALFFQGGQFF